MFFKKESTSKINGYINDINNSVLYLQTQIGQLRECLETIKKNIEFTNIPYSPYEEKVGNEVEKYQREIEAHGKRLTTLEKIKAGDSITQDELDHLKIVVQFYEIEKEKEVEIHLQSGFTNA